MQPEFGSIALMPFPFSDLSNAKVRPVLVLSRQTSGDDVVVCFITSRLDHQKTHGMLLPTNEQTGLKVKSVARFDKIATLHKRLLLGELGRVSADELREHRDAFLSVFGF